MILQDEILTVEQAVEANLPGAIVFMILAAMAGMFIIFAAIPSRREGTQGRKIMALLLVLTIALIIFAMANAWPEFTGLWMEDPMYAIGGLLASMVVGGLLLPSLFGLAIILLTTFVRRGGLI